MSIYQPVEKCWYQDSVSHVGQSVGTPQSIAREAIWPQTAMLIDFPCWFSIEAKIVLVSDNYKCTFLSHEKCLFSTGCGCMPLWHSMRAVWYRSGDTAPLGGGYSHTSGIYGCAALMCGFWKSLHLLYFTDIKVPFYYAWICKTCVWVQIMK